MSTAAGVHAQQADSSAREALPTVEVVSQRQAYRGDVPLQSLPQSIQVLSAETLSEVGAVRLDDALTLASGIARQNTFGGLWDSFAVRGFAGDGNVPSGYLVNGFNAGRGFSGRRDTSNVERIEVLKGPASALYGRGEPGGTINIVTRKPQFERVGSLELAGGSYSTYRVAGDYTGPLSPSLAFRINGAYEDAETFRDESGSEKVSLSPSLLLRLSDSASLSYELEWAKQEAPFDRGIVAVNGELGTVPVSRFLGEPADGNTMIEALGHQLVLQQDWSANWSLLAGLGYRDSSFEGYSSGAELAASRQPFFTEPTVLSRQRRYTDYSARDLTARAELSARMNTGRWVHHLLLGADAYDFELDQRLDRIRPTPAAPFGINVFDPVYGQPLPTPLLFSSTLEQERAHGVYLQDSIDLAPRWKATFGVRVDRFRQELTDRYASSTTEQSTDATSPRAGLVFEASDSASFYASYSKGFRPNSGSNAEGEALAPEYSSSYEIGTKLQAFAGRLSGTLALYKARKSNIVTADPVNAGFSLTAGEAESVGVELDVAGEISPNVRVSAAYAYTDAEITKAALDVDFGYELPIGSPLINIPKNSGHLLVMRELALGSRPLSAGVGVTYVGSRLGETGVPAFQLPSYTLLNLIGTYAASERLKFTLNLDNALDEEYYASSYARVWITPGAPRTLTLRALLTM
jgi:iron complex outermembrane recepter protein